MFKRAVRRGVTAGAVAGLGYGLYVAVVATPLIRYAETFETDGPGTAAVPELVASVLSIGGGVLYGILLGAFAFGVAFYLVEPAIPGGPRLQRSLVAAAGFLVVSGVPWLVLPPVPPGVEHSLPTDVRLSWYGASMVVAAFACGCAIWVYNRLARDHGSLVAPTAAPVGLAPIALLVAAAPTSRVAGPVPPRVAAVFTVVTVVGQIGLWVLLAAAHWWLTRRAGGAAVLGHDSSTVPPEFR
jgi:predicted cobalt transporter CbtA